MFFAYNNPFPLDIGATFPGKLYASYHRERVASQPVKTTLAFLRSIVFDSKNMPWFEETYHAPEESWRTNFLTATNLKPPSAVPHPTKVAEGA